MFFMPYTGFFTEKAKRYSGISSKNDKNKIEDYRDIVQSTTLLNIDMFDTYLFMGCDLHDRRSI